MRTNTRLGSIVLTALALAACDNDGVGLETTSFEVRLASTSGASSVELGSDLAHVELEEVLEINITVSAVQVLPESGEEGEDGSWITLDNDDVDLDLTDLPAEGVALANAELEAGDYKSIRLLISGTPTIVFANEVTVGQVVYPADEPIDLDIPSAAQSGIKVSVDFSVEVTDVVTITFDETTSVRNVTATGADKVIMNPVLTAQAS